MNKTLPKLLRRSLFVLGLAGALLHAEDSLAQKKKKKGAETPAAAAPARPQNNGPANGPKPYKEVITAKAKSKDGLFKVHQIEDKYFYEIPDSLFGRDMLMVVRIAKTADGIGYGGENTNNLVFVANTQGLLSPSATGAAKFDEKTLIEFNIDNNGDNVEDLVLQAIVMNGKMRVYGPYRPAATGTRSVIVPSSFSVQADVTPYGQAAKIGEENGIKVFAGPRDDPFFFDLVQYQKVITGAASGFNNPGDDTFKGTNVMSIVIEVPKSRLGAGSTGALSVWAESKKAIN